MAQNIDNSGSNVISAEEYRKRISVKKPKTSASPKVKESLVLKACIELLYNWGCELIRNNTGAYKKDYTRKKDGVTKSHYIRYGKKGSGDIIMCSPYGRYVEVETKCSTGKLSEDQERRQFNIERRGGVYVPARSVDDLVAAKAQILAKPIWGGQNG